MLISIVIPTFNRLSYLKKTIESVRAQSIKSREIIVVDNASSDGTKAWLEEQNDIFVIRQDVLVPSSKNWVTSFNSAKGDFVVLLSDDDLLCPDCLMKVETVSESANLSLIVGRHDVIDENGKIIQSNDEFTKIRSGLYSPRESLLLFSKGVMFRYCSIFFNRNLLSQIDMDTWFNKYTVTAADSALVQYMASKLPIYVLDQKESIGQYRVWKNSSTARLISSKEWQKDIDVWTGDLCIFSKNILTKKEIEKSVNEIKYSNLIFAIINYRNGKSKSIEMSLYFLRRLATLLFVHFSLINLLRTIKYVSFLFFKNFDIMIKHNN
jgi:glycosyltransferase involved in cell wall biosynthesis